MYSAFILEPNSCSTAIKRWSDLNDSLQQVQNMEEWNELNLSIYRATRETKLQSLHFKILNRILPCHKFLQQICIKPSDSCDQFGRSDSIIHFLLECPSVQSFLASDMQLVWSSRRSAFGRSQRKTVLVWCAKGFSKSKGHQPNPYGYQVFHLQTEVIPRGETQVGSLAPWV